MVQCNKGLVQQREMIAAVLLPAILVRISALRLFLAVADGLERVRANTILLQDLLGSVRTAFTQSQVVLSGTALVAVAFNLYAPALLLDQLRSLCQRLLRIRTQVSLVVVEENVFDHLGKELIVTDGWRRGSRCRRWSCLRSHRNLRGSFLRSGRALGGQMIRGGLRGRNRLRSAGINLVAVQGNVGCIFGAPGEGCRLPSFNRSRVG